MQNIRPGFSLFHSTSGLHLVDDQNKHRRIAAYKKRATAVIATSCLIVIAVSDEQASPESQCDRRESKTEGDKMMYSLPRIHHGLVSRMGGRGAQQGLLRNDGGCEDLWIRLLEIVILVDWLSHRGLGWPTV